MLSIITAKAAIRQRLLIFYLCLLVFNLQILKMKTQHQATSTKSHRARILAWLKTKPLTTFQARDDLDIPSPAPRIFELRHNDGYSIATHDVYVEGHRIAQYVLITKKFFQADLFEGDFSHE